MATLTSIYDEKNPDQKTYAIHADDGKMIGTLARIGSKGWEIFSTYVGPIELISSRRQAIEIMEDAYHTAA